LDRVTELRRTASIETEQLTKMPDILKGRELSSCYVNKYIIYNI